MNLFAKLRVQGFNSLRQHAVRTTSFKVPPRIAIAAYRNYTTMTSKDIRQGWACYEKGGPLIKGEFPMIQFNDDSVDIDITCCGICGSDIHCIDSGWYDSFYPMVAGHEIVGRVTRVGKNVKHLKVGDRAGVGCQCESCHRCRNCLDKKENLCEKGAVLSFNDHYYSGEKTYGGFSDKWRGEKEFVFKIPEELSDVEASSILCGGITTFAPLKRYGVGPGSKVAVLGLGGLGHFATQFAKAMGAEVVAYDVVPDKAKDAKALGCDDYVLVQNPEEAKRHFNTFTHIVATKILNKNWDEYFTMLAKGGIFIVCDIPEVPLSGINTFNMVGKQLTIAATFIAPPSDIEEAFALAAKKGIHTWANEFKMDQINDAIQYVREGNPRYRAVVVN